MALVTLGDTKLQLNIPTSDTTQDVELLGYIDAATTPESTPDSW